MPLRVNYSYLTILAQIIDVANLKMCITLITCIKVITTETTITCITCLNTKEFINCKRVTCLKMDNRHRSDYEQSQTTKNLES